MTKDIVKSVVDKADRLGCLGCAARQMNMIPKSR